MVFGDILGYAATVTTHVYFPLTGVISMVSSVSNQRPIEMGMIGFEGMLGATLALGIKTSPLNGLVLSTGSALRMPATDFLDQLRESNGFQQVLDRYLYVMIEQLALTAACNCFHDVRARLARWLLMMDDRAQSDKLDLTHMFLAEMLGVRRSAITIAAGDLQERKFISYSRGHICILSRSGLEAASCGCYAKANRSYQKMLPTSDNIHKPVVEPAFGELT